jgi:hypothetical protein
MQGVRIQTYAVEPYFYWPALIAALLDAMLFPVAQFTNLIAERLVLGGVTGSASVLLLLFVRVLLDTRVRRAVAEANEEMQKSGQLWIPLRDPEWGVFGAAWGGGHLAGLRLVLLGEFLLALVLAGRGGPLPTPLLLALAGFGVTVLLTLSQMKRRLPSRGPTS